MKISHLNMLDRADIDPSTYILKDIYGPDDISVVILPSAITAFAVYERNGIYVINQGHNVLRLHPINDELDINNDLDFNELCRNGTHVIYGHHIFDRVLLEKHRSLKEDEYELELTADPFMNDSENYDGTSLRSDEDLGVFDDDELEDTCEYVNDDDDYTQEENYE